MKYEEYLATLKPAQLKIANRAFSFGEESGLGIAIDVVQRACPWHEEGQPGGCIHCGWAVGAIVGDAPRRINDTQLALPIKGAG